MEINDVVQFNEKHKWCGSLGIVTGVKKCGNDTKYTIVVPIPMQGTAFIFVMESEYSIEYVGKAILIIKGEESGNN